MTAERLFVMLALPFGLALCFGTPPFGGGDEHFHFQRTIEVAYGGFLSRATDVPIGFVRFLEEGFAVFVRPHPSGYTLDDYRELASITVDASRSADLLMNAFTVHNPVNYIIPAAAVRALAWVDPPVLLLFWVARVASLCVAVTLVWCAIRAIPTHKYALASLAMLPSAVFYRSMVTADGVTIGAAFLFIAFLLRACLRTSPLDGKEIAQLCGSAALVALSKGAYAPLACMLIAIPQRRFANVSDRVRLAALGTVPAFVVGFGWMLLVKQSTFANFRYNTPSGKPNAQEQLSFILHEPLSFLATLANTVTQPSFIPNAAIGVIGEIGHGNIFLPTLTYVLLPVLVAILLLASPKAIPEGASYSAAVKLLGLGVIATCVMLTLTLLYLHWTDVRAPIVHGFQGRYVIPLLPLLLAAAPERTTSSHTRQPLLFVAIAAVGFVACAIALLNGFFKVVV